MAQWGKCGAHTHTRACAHCDCSAGNQVAMRCVCCGCDKDAGAFSGAQKRESAAKRTCASCTAAATVNVNDDCSGSGVVPSASAARSGAAQLEARQSIEDTLRTGMGANDAASAEQESTARACSACGKQLAHGGQPPRLEEVWALQAVVLLRQGLSSRALERSGWAQAGVHGADGLHHLLGQRRPTAVHTVRLRVTGRGGLRACGV